VSPVPVFRGHVNTRGKLIFDDRAGVLEHVRSFGGQAVDVVIKKHRAQRTSQANRYYFGVVVKMLAEFCGYENDEMHETLAMRFLRIEDCPVTGAPRRARTPDQNTKEFSEYVDACVRFAAELGVVIPEASKVEAA
jgi:hypothetical protein